jgi:O-antigen ligase
VFFLSVFIFSSNPRLFNFYKSVKEYNTTKNYNPSASEKSRLLSWDAAIKLIAEAPLFGYGVGDANTALVEKYKELGYTKNYNNNYNAHNQFLQSFLQNGILGGGLLLFIFVILAKRMKGSLNEMAVLVILFTSLFFEAMLVRFNGIVFFSIVVPLLLKKRSILGGRIIRSSPKKDSHEKDIIFT